MRKGLLYCLVGVLGLGAGVVIGKYSDYLNLGNVEGGVISIREDKGKGVKEDSLPALTEGFKFEGYSIDINAGVGVYRGSDGYYYKFHYDLKNHTLTSVEVSEDFIEL